MDVQDTPTHYQPAHELLKQLEAGTLTSEALITALLERIRDQNPAINAIVALDEHSALASAREAVFALHGVAGACPGRRLQALL